MEIASPSSRLATRLSFFVAGFVMACWAPLVPFAKARVGADEGQLGLLLLCLGVGSLIAMPVTGMVSARTGAKPMILLGGFALALILPVLALAGSPLSLGAALLVFGASLGTIDVAMNIQSIEVEKAAGRPMLSGFHAMFSLGGVAGAGGMTLLLTLGLPPLPASVFAAVLAVLAIAVAMPRLPLIVAGEPPAFVLPRGIVLLIAVLAGITFLVEGAMLDWGALLMQQRRVLAAEQAGMGYMMFSVAMTVGRLAGDRITALLGPFRVLTLGAVLAIAGFVIIQTAGSPIANLSGFGLIGIGAANIVPVLFSAAGRQSVMPASLAIAAVTTVGYAGVLAGPATVGFVSQHTSLPIAFWMLAALLVLLPLSARAVAR
ncbi:MFS transporter [Cereibacter sp. SYSU M97828]|nr:MFS transporter [Cereibacter flavus]